MVEYQKNSLKTWSGDTDVLCDAAGDSDIIVALGGSKLSDRMGSETLYNTILFIGNDGEILGRHRKLIPTHAERIIWGMGNFGNVRVFETPIGVIGGIVCYGHQSKKLYNCIVERKGRPRTQHCLLDKTK